MGALKWILIKLGGFSRKLAMRSSWLAKRLWVVMLADVLWTTRRHWVRLEPQERSRLLELAKKSQGRPAKNLSKRERREASDLLDKLGHIEYAGNLAGIVLPFRPLSRLAAKFLESRRSDAKKRLDEIDAAEGNDHVVIPTKPGAEEGGAHPPQSESEAGSKA